VTRYRDEQLGAALRALETPAHGPGFYADLHRRLGQERAARRAAVRRRWIARRGGLRWGVRIAFAAAAATAVWLVAGLPDDERVPPVIRPELAAAEIQAKVRTALAGAETLTGELVVRGRSYENAYGWEEPVRWRFALTARGDLRLTGLTLRDNMTYDAGRGVQRSLNPSASLGGEGPLFAAERSGVAPGPPDPGPTDDHLQRDFGAFVRALLAANDPGVRETTHDGRPAWQLEVRAQVSRLVPESSGDRFSIWVDQQTGIPVRVVEQKGGRVLDELRIEKLVVDQPLPRRLFTLPFPEGGEITRSDEGFRRVELGEVAGAVGYDPLVPAWLPAGYELAEVAVAPGSGVPTGVEGGNPPSTDVVSLAYRRGLDRFLVTTRLRHVSGFADVWSDPLATGEGIRDRPEPVRLQRGALSGVEANLLIVPRNTPHIWALADELVVTVSGDLSRTQLVRVAESLVVEP
jgi:hypothetical protein